MQQCYEYIYMCKWSNMFRFLRHVTDALVIAYRLRLKNTHTFSQTESSAGNGNGEPILVGSSERAILYHSPFTETRD